ncbi:MAG: HIT family protein [Gammaproteobacteria bacterium]|nr:HIT family protein [Gammaproteobacteria bacterium]
MTDCPLCRPEKETVLWSDARCRVILVDDPDYAGFCRVIWQQHAKEMTDLVEADRARFMAVVFAVEQVLRVLMNPDKINLASLGNQVPHLHWHVIPRFAGDAHFPDPVWATRKRDGKKAVTDHARLAEQMKRRLNELFSSQADR